MAAAAVLSPAAAAPPTDLPSRAEAEEVCQVVAGDHWSFSGRTLGEGVFDINNDGEPDRVKGRSLGTMHITSYEVTSRDGKPIPISPVGFEWKTYGASDAAWLIYNGRTYYVTANDILGRYRVYLSYVAPDNAEYVLCEFAPRVTELLLQQTPSDVGFCLQLAKAEPQFLAVAKTSSPSRVEGRRETSTWGSLRVDFDNDGADEDLFLLELASGAGRGCSSRYYDVADSAGGIAKAGAKHALLMELQGVELEAVFPGPTCEGNQARWFTHDGLVYLDNRYWGTQPSNPRAEFHHVSVIEDGKPRLVCKGSFVVRHEISRYNGDLWKDGAQ